MSDEEKRQFLLLKFRLASAESRLRELSESFEELLVVLKGWKSELWEE